MKLHFSISAFGSSCVLLNWASEIKLDIHQEVVRMDHFICAIFKEEVLETVLAYHSLMVQLSAPHLQEEFIAKLKTTATNMETGTTETNSLFRIPVCYDTTFGLDLVQLSEEKKLSIAKIIDLHTRPNYPVYFIGFLPGFPYLGGLIETLHMPRKMEPRARITAGSVGIGGNQTGIYPQDSPGGWNLIGRTPISLFETKLQPPALLKAGDRVQFYAIDKSEFDHISEAIHKNNFNVEQEVWHD